MKVSRGTLMFAFIAFVVWPATYLTLERVFDFSGKQWLASLSEQDRQHIKAVRKKISNLQKSPWPTFVEFKDGRVAVVFANWQNHYPILLIQGEVKAVPYSGEQLIAVSRVVAPGEPNHEELGRTFLQ